MKRAYAYLAILLLAACVAMEAPKSFNDRLAYGYAALASVRNNAAGLLERGRISKDEGRAVQGLADQARTALDLARGTAGKGDLATAQGQLDTALSILTQLEARLKASQ